MNPQKCVCVSDRQPMKWVLTQSHTCLLTTKALERSRMSEWLHKDSVRETCNDNIQKMPLLSWDGDHGKEGFISGSRVAHECGIFLGHRTSTEDGFTPETKTKTALWKHPAFPPEQHLTLHFIFNLSRVKTPQESTGPMNVSRRRRATHLCLKGEEKWQYWQLYLSFLLTSATAEWLLSWERRPCMDINMRLHMLHGWPGTAGIFSWSAGTVSTGTDSSVSMGTADGGEATSEGSWSTAATSSGLPLETVSIGRATGVSRVSCCRRKQDEIKHKKFFHKTRWHFITIIKRN